MAKVDYSQLECVRVEIGIHSNTSFMDTTNNDASWIVWLCVCSCVLTSVSKSASLERDVSCDGGPRTFCCCLTPSRPRKLWYAVNERWSPCPSRNAAPGAVSSTFFRGFLRCCFLKYHPRTSNVVPHDFCGVHILVSYYERFWWSMYFHVIQTLFPQQFNGLQYEENNLG